MFFKFVLKYLMCYNIFLKKRGNNVASLELASMYNLIDKENCKLQFLGKVCDIVSNRISDLPRI